MLNHNQQTYYYISLNIIFHLVYLYHSNLHFKYCLVVIFFRTFLLCVKFCVFKEYLIIHFFNFNFQPGTDALEFCDTSGTQVTATTLYLHNDGYPSAISHHNCCACIITASALSATIDLDILDLQLYDQTSTCMQTIFTTDNTDITSYNCTENNEYIVRNLLTSSGSSLTVTLKSEAAANGNGKALFRASGWYFYMY